MFVGWAPDPAAIAAGVLGYLLIIIFALALALMFSVSQVFLRDTGQIVAVVNNFIRFGVPMMYPYAIVAERFARPHRPLPANPIADAVLLVQRCFWVPTTSDPDATVVDSHARRPLHPRLHRSRAGAWSCLVVAQRVFNAARETKMPGEALMTDSIIVENVSKQFTMPTTAPSSRWRWRWPAVSRPRLVPRPRRRVLHASQQGESIGLMGLNGSGKSTLLKMISGVMRARRRDRCSPAAGSPA